MGSNLTKISEPSLFSDRHTFWSDENFHTLELSNTQCEDSGSYSITARNAHGSVSCKSHLVVDKGIRAYVAPEFLYGMDDCTVKENGEIRLIARVEAYPSVGVMWLVLFPLSY